ncbi:MULTISPECIES: GNAT family N-acetyltransferase [unclassified Pseudochrobactrum]|uniref:GNAT family N-acetyltransferase n=1 Tax=unclassified Pseudochrobactrum TaxID=2647013 RepID=UPI0003A11E2D|nr:MULTISPECIES: GNAT family N-acetyltransferase [unclassified Pseudochrobactrum]
MQLRQATNADLAMIARIGADAWASHIFSHETEEPDQRRRAELAFLHSAQDYLDYILVAEQDGVICGWGARDTNQNYISDIWVDPAHHGQGIGTLLVDALLAQIVMLGFQSAEIGTHARNLPAIKLYEKCGFRIIRRYEEWSDSLARVVEKVKMQADL